MILQLKKNDSSNESDFDSTAQDVSQIVDEVNSSQSIETQRNQNGKKGKMNLFRYSSTIMFDDGQYN